MLGRGCADQFEPTGNGITKVEGMQNCSDSHARVHTELVEGGPRRVVFLHGLMGRGKNFTTIARALTETTTSLLVDIPNHGESCWTDSFDYAELADLVAEELRRDFCQDEPAVILGTRWVVKSRCCWHCATLISSLG